MTFVELYGDALDTELGSADRTERFTVERRKRAVNLGQREFVRLTGCFLRQGEILLTGGIQEYDLEALLDADTFIRLADQQPWVQITDTNGNVRTLTGEDFPRTDISRLDQESPGWRTATATTPESWYIREVDGATNLGFFPPPSAPPGEIWKLFVPYVGYPADMNLDTDEPFATTAGGNAKTSLRIYHQALAHRAAAELEKLRRNYPQISLQMNLFMGFVRGYLGDRRETAGSRIVQSHSYFRAASRRGWNRPEDPRRY